MNTAGRSARQNAAVLIFNGGDMSTFFTAAVCVYNTEKYLPKCLDSILEQEYKNFELLLIDDGSTDKSGQICDEYAKKDCRVRVIHTKNQGVLIARKTAFENAKGDYVIVFDSDDTVDPKIFVLIDEEIQRSHCDMVFFDLNDCYPDGKITHIKLFDSNRTFSADEKRELWLLLLRNKFSSLCCKCIKKAAFTYDVDTEFYKGYCRGEDRLIAAHIISQLETFSYLPVPLYNYQRFASQLTKTYPFEQLRLTSYATEEILSLIEADGCFDSELKNTLYCLVRQLYRGFLQPNISTLSIRQSVELIRASEESRIFKLCTDTRADKYSSMPVNLRFWLLRHGMYTPLVLLTKLKNKI